MALKTLLVVLATVFPAASGTADRVAVTGTLDLRAELNMRSLNMACPPGIPKTTECHPRTGQGTVSGLGRVTETYSYDATTAAPECGGLVKVLGHTAVFAVEGKGEIRLAV